MPHTPLLQRIVEACGLVDEATRRKMDVDRVIEERDAHRLSRRKFIGVAALGAGLAACDRVERLVAPVDPPAARSPGGNARVVVVGAGLAGLTCAYRLKQAGINATVYEAGDRIGGRCWTQRGHFADGQIAEHGGELIDQSHRAIRQLAQEFRLKLDNVLAAEARGTEPLFYFDGAPYSYAEATRDIKQIWQRLHGDLSDAGYPTLYNRYTARGFQLDNTSIAQWIDQTVPGGRRSRLGRLLEVAYTIEYGAEASDQSSLNLIYLLGYRGQGQLRIFGPSNEKYHVRGGNDQIVARLAEQLTGQIVTGTALTAIARNGDEYRLGFTGGRVVAADKVVLAIPFSILRDGVDVSRAGFSELKRTAIAELGMGANAKLNVQFTDRYWATLGCNGETIADTGYQLTWDVSRAQSGATGILVNYTGGNRSLAIGADSAAKQTTLFLRQVEPVLPGLSRRYNGRSWLDNWPRNRWVRGSYSYWKVGQYTRIAGAEGEPSGGCHFAGEHTSIDFQGYLNGAVESGERAAREVLTDVRTKNVAA